MSSANSVKPLDVTAISSSTKVDYSVGEIGSYSTNAEGEFVDDRSSLRFYCPPEKLKSARGTSRSVLVDWDLNVGLDTFIQKDESVREYLDNSLKWLQLHRPAAVGGGRGGGVQQHGRDGVNGGEQMEQLGIHETTSFADLFCERSMLTGVLCTPYENTPHSNGWKIAVCRFNGVLYANEFNKFDVNPLTMYPGFKFEYYIAADSASDERPDPEVPVNNKRAFLSIVKARLGSHTAVFCAEMDCCDRSKEPYEYVELKTTATMQREQQLVNFKRHKLLRWWAQCVLSVTPTVTCGFKNNRTSVVRQLKEYVTSEIPQLCLDEKTGRKFWNENVCFNFCDKFLNYVKDTVKKDYSEAIYVFSYEPASNFGSQVTCTVESPVTPDSEFVFLPSWFTGDPQHSRRS